MSVQKQYSKSAFASFCPAAPLIVAGTAQWGVDEAFSSTEPSLEVRQACEPNRGMTDCASIQCCDVPRSVGRLGSVLLVSIHDCEKNELSRESSAERQQRMNWTAQVSNRDCLTIDGVVACVSVLL